MTATTHGNILADVKAEALVDVQTNTIAVVKAETLTNTLTNVESENQVDTLVITIEDEDSEKFGDTLAKEMGKALVETPVEAIELEMVKTVGEKLKD